ncbi:hypothetical protein EXIGLDRAFT_836530 [Exidia glandulosa HHB12029]|uniref:Protein kinase domain-containing protein n=1 Tax=Exidia glandulosa HHB12029 TaxID=1314781 RepID=A0A165HR19_EXIGL|nr:hypothetical protein EXIGLDRAFT_836530 [Exidia glandulosa HHB12029]
MAVVARRQPSPLVSTGLAAATVALSVAGAATDAVPIAKQILNSAAHISVVAEKIQKKREAMYTLIEKADIYATQIDIAVAGRVLDPSLQRRLQRLYSVFLKIEALVDVKAGVKNNALTRVLQNVITKPSRAETLLVELEREIQLFQLLTGIQLSLIVGETARAVVADMKYDGQFRVLRDCDIDKRDIIERCETEQGTVVWASARVDGQLLVIRYLDPSPVPQSDNNIVSEVAARRRAPYHEYLENVAKVSTIRASHPHIVQLYGLHIQGPAAVFRLGTFPLSDYLRNLRLKKGSAADLAVKYLRLVYKMLDASAHLADAHGLLWVGETAIVDDNGEPRIGLFDDIVRADPDHLPNVLPVYWDIFFWFNTQYSEETGVVEQVHDSSLHTLVTEHLRHRDDNDYLFGMPFDKSSSMLFLGTCHSRKS